MPETPTPSNYNEFLRALEQNTKQLERLGELFDRLNERSRDFATRADLEKLVARDALDPQLNDIRAQIKRVNDDRIEDKITKETQIKELRAEQISKQDRLWMRLGQIAGLVALVATLLEYLSHIRFLP